MGHLLLFLEGIAVGLAIAAPVGPIGALCVSRTLRHGAWIGLASGLGAACADAFYGAVAGFGVSSVAVFLLDVQDTLRLLGGAFLLVENRPRQQSLGEALAPARGELVIFPVNERPVEGKRGVLRASVRHGVSRIEAGERFTLGIIFHDAA